MTTNSPSTVSSFAVGDIVTLHSHPYNLKSTSIVISGDHQTIPPLMVVSEVLLDIRNTHDEVTGNPITRTGHGQCKCIWFSTKSNKFEEAWLKTEHIKKIYPHPTSPDPNKFENINTVTLSTHEIEIGKEKSSLTSDTSTYESKSTSTINPLLTFVSPILQLMEIKNNDNNKEPKYNPKNGEQRRFLPVKIAKCKWYNPSTDKMSEVYLPVEALNPISQVSIPLLEKIQQDIISRNYYQVLTKDAPAVIEPKRISFRSGIYYLSYYDYLTNKNLEINIGNLSNIIVDTINEYYDDYVPRFENLDDISVDIVNEEKAEFLKKVANDKFIRIKYKDYNDKVTVRTINNIKLDDSKNPKYVTGYCFLRNEKRTFIISGIIQIQTLKIQSKTQSNSSPKAK